jgi:glycerol-3-phosphate O-acyltransferase 1/2
VVLSQLLGEFSWLTEETLLRGFDVGFSGQLRCLAQHTLSLLRAHVVLLRVHQGDLVVVPRPGPGLTHLARLSAELLPAFLSEAVGGESQGLWVGGMCAQGRGDCSLPQAGPLLHQPVQSGGCWQVECRLRGLGSCRA